MHYVLLLILLSSVASANDLIELLGHPKWSVREKATASLYNSGVKHYQLILDNTDHVDLEIRMRCRRLADVLAKIVPLEFYTGNNKKYVVYKLSSMMVEYVEKPIDDDIKKQLELLMNIAPPDIHGKFILDLYKETNRYYSIKLLPYLGRIANQCPDADNNPYATTLLLHFNKGDGFNELETLDALSRIKSYNVYRLLIVNLLLLDSTDALFFRHGEEWISAPWRKEAYISVLQNYPYRYHLLSLIEHPFCIELLNQYRSMPVRSLYQMECEFKER